MKFTTWTRRRGGVTIHVPAKTYQFDAASALLAAEMHMAHEEDADAVAVKPSTPTRYFARRSRTERRGLGRVAIIFAEEIPPVLEEGP